MPFPKGDALRSWFKKINSDPTIPINTWAQAQTLVDYVRTASLDMVFRESRDLGPALAVAFGLNRNTLIPFKTLADLTANSTAMAVVAASSTAMVVIAASNVAMNAVVTSSTAGAAIVASVVARSKVLTNAAHCRSSSGIWGLEAVSNALLGVGTLTNGTGGTASLVTGRIGTGKGVQLTSANDQTKAVASKYAITLDLTDISTLTFYTRATLSYSSAEAAVSCAVNIDSTEAWNSGSITTGLSWVLRSIDVSSYSGEHTVTFYGWWPVGTSGAAGSVISDFCLEVA